MTTWFTKRVLEIWNSNVNRWHAHRDHGLRNSGDGTDAHAARCVRLLMLLNPDASRDLILAVLEHDIGERVVGDVPYGAKRDPELRSKLCVLENDEMVRLGIDRVISEGEYPWLKLVDRLDAYLWVAHVAKPLLTAADWQEDADACVDLARRCGVEGLVVALIEEVLR